MIRNFPLSPEDSVRDDFIYELAKPLLQYGIKRHRKPTIKVPIILLTIDISLHHKNIELYRDFYMNRIPLLHTKSSKTTLLISEKFISRSTYKTIQELPKFTNMYKPRGFNVFFYHWDNELNKKIKGAYQAIKFKLMYIRATNTHNRKIHSNHQERSALHQTLCVIQKVYQTHDRITCGMHNQLKKLFSTRTKNQ